MKLSKYNNRAMKHSNRQRARNNRLRKREIEQLYYTPANRKLLYAALAIIAVVIILLLSGAVFVDYISLRTLLIMNCCAGLGAIIFIVIVGILIYRVSKQHLTGRWKR